MADFQTREQREPGPQPDPMLNEGRRSTGWVWLIGAIIAVVVVGTLFALNPSSQKTASDGAPPQTSGPSSAPKTPIAPGRTTGSAPTEQAPSQGTVR